MGARHRNNNSDLPAIIRANGDQMWYQNGDLHRDNNLPAIIYANGGQLWYQHNNLHRGGINGDLPAIICANGDQMWYRNGTCIKRVCTRTNMTRSTEFSL